MINVETPSAPGAVEWRGLQTKLHSINSFLWSQLCVFTLKTVVTSLQRLVFDSLRSTDTIGSHVIYSVTS